MFGQPNTPFGSSGGFGQQPSNTAPAFGSSAPAQGSLFGTPAPGGFGAPPSGGFGAPAPSGPFGQPAPAAPFGSSFGSPAPSTGGGLFGQPAPAPGFGSTFGAPAPLFPSAPTPGVFGQPAPAPSSAFGQPSAASGSIFGAPSTSTSPFGAQTSTFGSPAPAPSFGFGAPAPAFGAPASVPGGSLFGQQPAPAPVFGSSNTGGGGLFGQPAPAPSFGGSTFGAPAPSGGLFGQPAPGGFGAAPSSSPFGASGPQQTQEGTRGTPFQVSTKKDNNTTINLYSISAMQQYENKSFEELRFEDYSQGNKGSASTPKSGNPTGGFSFGSPTPAGGLFGSQPAPAPFGAPAPAPFGSAAPSSFGVPAPAPFGAPAPGGGLFGANAPAPFGASSGGLFGAPAPSPFGAPPSTGLFGSPSPAPFGAPSPAPFGASAPAPFGAPAPSGGLFGSSAPAPFGAPAPTTGGLFGAPAPSPFGAPSSGGSLFGQPAPAPFGAPSSGGLFGQPAQGGFSFGAKPPSTGMFGSSAPAPFSSFGSSAPAPFGNSGSSSLFNASTPAPYGYQPNPAPAAGIPQNTIIIPPTADEANVQGIRALMKSREEMEKSEIWKGENGGKSSVSTPTSVSEAESLDPSTVSKSFFRSHPSVVRVRPRGFPKTEAPVQSGPLLSGMGRSGAQSGSLMLPDSKVRSPALQLVVEKDSLRKPKLRQMSLPGENRSPEFAEEIDALPSPDPSTPGNRQHVDIALSIGGKSPRQSNDGPVSTMHTQQRVPNEESTPQLEAYYQKTVNSPLEPSPEVVSLAVKSKHAPKLSKDGYECNPPIEELLTYSDADLAAVPNFSVSRPGYGKVEWLGAVDIRGADLDRIVVIEPKDVSVYNQEESEGTKPAEGTRLNRAAYITYFEVFPKDNPDATQDEKEKFMERLEKTTTKKMLAEFLSYNKTTGEWKIRVRHFSRYALTEDDSEEEDGQNTAVRADIPKQRSRLVQNRQPTPFSKKPINGHSGLSPEESAATVARIRAGVEISSKKAMADLFPVEIEEEKPGSPVLGMEVEEENKISSVFKFVPPSKSALNLSVSRFSIVSSTLQSRKCCKRAVDTGFHMGKSFRVAWSPDGSFLSPFRNSSGLAISEKRPVYSPAFPEKITGSLLDMHLRFSESQTGMDTECPVFTLPSAKSFGGSVESHESLLDALRELSAILGQNSEGKSVFRLLYLLAGSKDRTSPMKLEEAVSQKAALIKWLVEECKSGVMEHLNKRTLTPISAVFAAFSSGDCETACSIAADAGFHDLACVISTVSAGGSTSMDLSRIVSECLGREHISNELERLLRNIAGDNRYEDSRYKNGMSDLDWRRRLALRSLVSASTGIEDTISEYLNDIREGFVPPPFPSYGEPTGVQSVQFKVLSAISSTTPLRLLDVVEPQGLTAFRNDTTLCFHLSAILEGMMDLRNASGDFDIICLSYASQLIAENNWCWAVFVILCVLPVSSSEACRRRIDFAKSIVLRYFGRCEGYTEVHRSFLEDIGIPSAWFAEAFSNRSMTVIEYVSHTLSFNPEAALQVLETRYLPSVFFMNRKQVNNLMGMLEGMAAAHNSVASGVVRFLALADNLRKVKLRTDKDVPITSSWLLEEHDELTRIFRSRLSTIRNQSLDYRFYVEYPIRVSLSSMLSEALSQLADIRLQLLSLAGTRTGYPIDVHTNELTATVGGT